MRLIYFVDCGSYYEVKGRIAVRTAETRKRFKRLVSWLCECINQDPEPQMKVGKMLIIWQSIGSARLHLAQNLRAEILKKFPDVEIELQEGDKLMYKAAVIDEPQAILTDSRLLQKLRGGNIRYLIGIF